MPAIGPFETTAVLSALRVSGGCLRLCALVFCGPPDSTCQGPRQRGPRRKPAPARLHCAQLGRTRSDFSPAESWRARRRRGTTWCLWPPSKKRLFSCRDRDPQTGQAPAASSVLGTQGVVTRLRYMCSNTRDKDSRGSVGARPRWLSARLQAVEKSGRVREC